MEYSNSIMGKLRIGMVASNALRIPPLPPEKYVPEGWSGAPELVVHFITEELVRRGHKVTLFASGDSATKAKLESVTKGSTWQTKDHTQYENTLISKAYAMAKQGHFDILHSHFDIRTAYYAPLVDTPTVSTLHSPVDGLAKDILQHFQTSQYYVSISNNQRKDFPNLQYISTVYHGVEVEKIPFRKEKEDYLVSAGRIVPKKGVAEAIEVAKKANMRLFIFGTPEEPDGAYWQKAIKPQIDQKQIVYKGFVAREKLFQYYSKAKAMLFPISWEEPFGLVAVEAMATGTPVIAFRRGALPEIIQQGINGFLVDNVEEMSMALARIDSINPMQCRKTVQENFTIEKMVDGYEAAYHAILQK